MGCNWRFKLRCFEEVEEEEEEEAAAEIEILQKTVIGLFVVSETHLYLFSFSPRVDHRLRSAKEFVSGRSVLNIPNTPVLSSRFGQRDLSTRLQQAPTLPSTSHLIQVEAPCQFSSYLKTQMIKLINIHLVAGRVGFDSLSLILFYFFSWS